MKHKRHLMLGLVAIVSCLILVVVSFGLLLTSRVKNKCTTEVGQEVMADAFRRYEWDQGAFVWLEEPDCSIPGERTGKIQVFPFTYQVTVLVKEQGSILVTPTQPAVSAETDTTAPEVTTQTVTVYAQDRGSVLPEQFILDVNEESDYIVKFLSDPEQAVYGRNRIRLEVVDTAGNSTEVEEELCIINLKESLELELGTELPEAEMFLAAMDSEISFVTDISTLNMMQEGNYEIVFLVDGMEAVSVLSVKDTSAPVLVLHPGETWLNKPIEPAAFIDMEASYDNSNAFDTIYAVEPDWTKVGEQTVTIRATDVSGNSVSETTTLLIKKDEKAPVVTVTDMDVKVGGTVSYKKAVSYYDDIDTQEEMSLSVERSSVNLKEVGTYEVTYTVTDCSGNATSVVGKINVLEEAPKWEDEDAIHEKAGEILDAILEDGMTDREKAYEIYKWIKNHVGYSDYSEKGNYIRGAYEGLFKRQGDCFVFASTAKELLTMAGISNIDIVKATKNPSHYWNLVYIEDGWYHFDSTPRQDKSEFFLLTDAELEAYSSTHKNTHIFDRSLYPEIK